MSCAHNDIFVNTEHAHEEISIWCYTKNKDCLEGVICLVLIMISL